MCCSYSDPAKETDAIVFHVSKPTPPTAAAGQPTPASPSPTGALELMETAFVRAFDATRLHRDHSIPGFLAQVTLTLVDKQNAPAAGAAAKHR